MTIRAAIVAGHNEVGQGAERGTDGVSEWAWSTKLANMIQAHDPAGSGWTRY
jgi:hypothetical protein